MDDLWVKLNAIKAAGLISDSGDRASFSPPQDLESSGRSFDGVAVTHPDLLAASGVAEKDGVLVEVEGRLTVFALDPLANLAAEQLG